MTTQTMQEIIPQLQEQLSLYGKVTVNVLNPDLAEGCAGKKVYIEGKTYIYRSLKSWMDLAELLHCKMHLPKEGPHPLVEITMEILESKKSFHLDKTENKEEKYGVTSSFFEIQKMEEPAFLYYYLEALNNVQTEKRKRILNLGVNRGDEFSVIKKQLDINKYQNMEFVGIDHSKTAIEYAQGRFEEGNVHFYAEDINTLESLDLGKFDLLISIGTLQSPSINFKPFFMNLVQNYLEEDAAVILGFPNSRWKEGEMIYGAKAPNYAMSEMSLLFNDVIFCKKYLQQKKYRVTITGKHYIFLTATRIGR